MNDWIQEKKKYRLTETNKAKNITKGINKDISCYTSSFFPVSIQKLNKNEKPCAKHTLRNTFQCILKTAMKLYR